MSRAAAREPSASIASSGDRLVEPERPRPRAPQRLQMRAAAEPLPEVVRQRPDVEPADAVTASRARPVAAARARVSSDT